MFVYNIALLFDHEFELYYVTEHHFTGISAEFDSLNHQKHRNAIPQ